MVINSFKGRYGFLSNFHVAPVSVVNQFSVRLTYASAEHAYQAAKAKTHNDHNAVMNALTPRDARRIGRSIECCGDWYYSRLAVMYRILEAKFLQNENCASALLSTSGIIYADVGGNTFWGVKEYSGRITGANLLGILLMEVRDTVRTDAVVRANDELDAIGGVQ